jgi:two-component system response regulator DevR
MTLSLDLSPLKREKAVGQTLLRRSNQKGFQHGSGRRPCERGPDVIRILIIDDHEIAREGLKCLLKSDLGFEIIGESDSAQHLIEMVESLRPNVVLLEALLPGVSGAEACRALTASHPEVSVLVVSASADDSIIDECIKAGAKGYLINDIDSFMLKQSIRAVHRGEGAVSPSIAAKVLERLRVLEDRSVVVAVPVNDRQLNVLRLIAAGFSNREIGTQMHLSENTIKSHVHEIFRKLNVRNRAEAAVRANQEGWLDLSA